MVQLKIEVLKMLAYTLGVIGFLVLGYIGLVIFLYRGIGERHENCRRERLDSENKLHDRIDDILIRNNK